MKIDRPVLRIPTLAIHLTKADERKSFNPNLQNNFYPVLATEVKAKLGGDGNAPAKKKPKTAEAAGEGGEGEGERHTERHHPLLVEMIATELG